MPFTGRSRCGRSVSRASESPKAGYPPIDAIAAPVVIPVGGCLRAM